MQTTPLTKNSKTVLALSVFLLLAVFSFGQSGKAHYIIKNPDNVVATSVYENALKDFDFASYRFYDKRRVIKFLNSNVELELYSAKELLELYQKPVNPLTIMDNVAKKDIAFVMYGGKVQVATIKK